MSRTAYTLQDLRRALSAITVERGQDYARRGQVHARQYDGAEGRYAAQVNGSREDPYSVRAQVLPGRTGIKVYGTCTCPMRLNCKHVAAVLVDALTQPNTRYGDARPAGMPPLHAPALPATLDEWLQQVRQRSTPSEEAEPALRSGQRQLRYLLSLEQNAHLPPTTVTLVHVRLRKDGTCTDPKPWANAYATYQPPPSFVTPADDRIRRMLLVDAKPLDSGRFTLGGAEAAAVLRAMLTTGRCHLARFDSPPLAVGAARTAQARWEMQPDASQRVGWSVTPPAEVVLPLAPPWYVDPERGECGPLETDLTPTVAEALALAPRVQVADAPAVRSALMGLAAPALPLPEAPEERVEHHAPVPHLALASHENFGRGYGPFGFVVHRARLTYDYGGVQVGGEGNGDVRAVRGDQVVRIPRDRKLEKQALERLAQAGLMPVPGTPPQRLELTFYEDMQWLGFVATEVPVLREQGWQIDIDRDFRFRLAEVGEWYAEVKETGNQWFDLDLGVEIDGQRMQLLPIILEAVREHPYMLQAPATPDPDTADEKLFVQLEDERFVPVPLSRIRPVLTILHELLSGDDAPGEVRLSRLDAVRLADLDAAGELKWSGGEKLRELGTRLAKFESIAAIAAPSQLRAALRPYQLQGLAWLQFLREYGLSGILADDMGLGKTVEALAHILVEKESGRLARPALVVCPTSLVPNWKAEAARFAPGLRVHVSHGLNRKSAFAQIAEHDLVITTYPLLARDREVLLAQPFHLAILDEAQQIKNAQTIAAKVVTQLNAEHRLCLTGTPLENHLGELWSLFHFLMPGFLGDAKTFRALYRTPIEKQGDDLRRGSLVRRLRPFMLRRTKEQVAAELPAKTEIVVPVEIAGAQRDLYETVRTAMDERVRKEIAARGLQQSQIVVLDALLKLRQICCDPRLLKLQSAKAVKESAKLDTLVELLEELMTGGHRVLLFSQFTSMLALIESELDKRSIGYVKLTGETRDRAKPVQAFQSGTVPLFLISLKAGGTGLNLTAADTVVHYDPWWNPAVENQATDRAHRIGQDKPVFVYKLIVSGSVEEKIAKLQASKAALASAVLGEGQVAGPALTSEDVRALFEPLG
jgi:SNF2 family DNA or RNA helicase